MTSRVRGSAIVAIAVAMLAAAPAALGTVLPPVGPPAPPPSAGAPTAIGTLSASHPILSFHGKAGNPTPLPLVNSPAPVVCGAGCSEYRFVAGAGTPILVSVKDNGGSPDDGWDLYVWGPTGALVGSANGIGANGQAVTITKPASGTYTVAVTFTYEYDQGASFHGEVRLMRGPTWSPPPPTCGITVSGTKGCFELPVLRAVPASDLHVGGLPPAASTPLGFPLPVNAPTPTSCYIDETASLDHPSAGAVQHPTLRCLRFTSDIENIGAGLLDIRIPWLANGKSGFVPGQCQADQAVMTAGGRTVTRPGGPCEFHAAHAHFHYQDLISFSLYKATPSGPGPKIGSSLKESFCLGDDDYFGFGTVGHDGARSYIGQPGCNLPATVTPSSTTVDEGISPGWGDVYTWDTPDQFIDITTVAAGVYDLVERTNPSKTLLVAGPQQTCALTKLRLTATAVTQLSTAASVPCPAT